MAIALTNKQMRFLRSLEEEGIFDIREDYSGRGMYGKTCVGFVYGPRFGKGRSAFQIGMAISSDEDCAYAFDGTPREDSMGLDNIIYFPNVVWGDEDQDDIEDDEDDDEDDES